jgi:hypothetical protein
MIEALQLLRLHAEAGLMLMKKRFRWFLLVALSLGLLAASPALADQKRGGRYDGRSSWKSWDGGKHHRGRHYKRHYHHKGCNHTDAPGGEPIPELDPGLLGSAAVLLIGGTLVLHGRRRVEANA